MSIVIVGASGHGREVLDVVEACGQPFGGFVDDGQPDQEPLRRRGVGVLGGLDALAAHTGTVLLGLGDGAVRQRVARGLSVVWAAPVVHPLASLGSDVELEAGTVVRKGDLIAQVGATGRASGPHLDWRMNWLDRRVDPQLLLEDAPPPETASGN